MPYYLGIDGGGVTQREFLAIMVKVVLALRRHGEGTGQRHFNHAIGVGAQEFHIANLDRVFAADRTDHPRDG